jgi:hypothetical protein
MNQLKGHGSSLTLMTCFLPQKGQAEVSSTFASHIFSPVSLLFIPLSSMTLKSSVSKVLWFSGQTKTSFIQIQDPTAISRLTFWQMTGSVCRKRQEKLLRAVAQSEKRFGQQHGYIRKKWSNEAAHSYQGSGSTEVS